MNSLYISGSPRKNSNTDFLLKETLSETGGDFLKITDYQVEPCRSCWTCLKSGECALDDDMNHQLIPRLLTAEIMILGTPVYFNIELGALLGLQSRFQAFLPEETQTPSPASHV
jgi:multimeric flavodoxin WrbA